MSQMLRIYRLSLYQYINIGGSVRNVAIMFRFVVADLIESSCR